MPALFEKLRNISNDPGQRKWLMLIILLFVGLVIWLLLRDGLRRAALDPELREMVRCFCRFCVLYL